MENELINFEGTNLRKEFYKGEWWFSIIDIIKVLTDSPSATTYWAKLKAKENKSSGQLFPFTEKLKFLAPDGKMRPTDCANTEGVLRIIMSVPSPKAEPLKMWLAQVGREHLEETENPELGFERMTALYKAKGYPDDWIDKRLENIKTRKLLTEEWKNRDVKEGQEYSILTAIIAKGTFGLTPTEHKDYKGLTKPSQNLRDHMTPLELIFTSLGEELTRQRAITEDAKGFDENKNAAIQGGNTAGKALKMVEAEEGKKIVSKENYLKSVKKT